MDNQVENTKTYNQDSFALMKDKMIKKNSEVYQNSRWDAQNRVTRVRDYSYEEIEAIVASGSLIEQQRLSRNYFYKDGYYKHILLYYATLLTYSGILIPNPSIGKSLSESHIQKRYYAAMDYIEAMNLPVLLTNCMLTALIDGTYYGVRVEDDKNNFAVLDLPTRYCSSPFKDTNGNDLIQFDLSYFDTLGDQEVKQATLNAYPKAISKAYHQYHTSKRHKFFTIPSEISICFQMLDGRPLFLPLIPKTLEYEDAVDLSNAREAEEARKIIVQKIPHLTDGRLVFEPDEAAEMHEGAVGMLAGNENVRVLTTYADVDAITSQTTSDNQYHLLDRSEKNIYAQGGVSNQIFQPNNAGTMPTSLKRDLALVMYLANKFSIFISTVLNEHFANANINFKYQILPVSYQNQNEYIDSSYKLVSLGYSFLLPAIAQGLSQKDLSNVKDLENQLLKLDTKLKPLSSSFTQSAKSSSQSESNSSSDEGGRPALKDEQKSDKTLKNAETIGQ